MRILHLSEAPIMGGINTFLLVTLNEFVNRPEVENYYAVLSDKPHGWFFDRMETKEMQLAQIPCHGPLDLMVPWRIRDFIEENQIDLVHVHGYRSNFYVQTMRLLGLSKVRLVTTKHGLPSDDGLRMKFYYSLDQLVTRYFDYIIAVDNSTLIALERSWGVPHQKLRLIHNPAPVMSMHDDSEFVRLCQKLQFQSEAPVYLFAGRIEREKGIFELLKAHKNVIKKGVLANLLIVGDGSMRYWLEDFISSELTGANVFFVGPQVDIYPYLKICDFLILPSYHEGLPFVILEAMSVGKPVIATSVGGILDIVVNQENGILVKPKDVAGLTDAILYCLANPEKLLTMGTQAEQTVSKGYSVSDVVSEILTIYQDVLKQ